MPSQDGFPQTLTLKQAAQAVGCSEALVRKIVKQEGFPVIKEDAPRGGFRYLIMAEEVAALAHKVSMRRYGRKVGEAHQETLFPTSQPQSLTGLSAHSQALSTSREEVLPREEKEAESLRNELKEARADRDAWRSQAQQLAEALSRLSLPAPRESRAATQPGPEAASPIYADLTPDTPWPARHTVIEAIAEEDEPPEDERGVEEPAATSGMSTEQEGGGEDGSEAKGVAALRRQAQEAEVARQQEADRARDLEAQLEAERAKSWWQRLFGR